MTQKEGFKRKKPKRFIRKLRIWLYNMNHSGTWDITERQQNMNELRQTIQDIIDKKYEK